MSEAAVGVRATPSPFLGDMRWAFDHPHEAPDTPGRKLARRIIGERGRYASRMAVIESAYRLGGEAGDKTESLVAIIERLERKWASETCMTESESGFEFVRPYFVVIRNASAEDLAYPTFYKTDELAPPEFVYRYLYCLTVEAGGQNCVALFTDKGRAEAYRDRETGPGEAWVDATPMPAYLFGLLLQLQHVYKRVAVDPDLGGGRVFAIADLAKDLLPLLCAKAAAGEAII